MSPNKKHPKFSGEKNTWYAFEEICQLSFSSREKFLNLLEAAVCNETSIKSDSEIKFALQIYQLWLLRVFLRTGNSTLLEDMFFSLGKFLDEPNLYSYYALLLLWSRYKIPADFHLNGYFPWLEV